MSDADDSLKPLDEDGVVAIRAALERLLASESFRSAPQLSAFLCFIVTRTLDGRGRDLKGYTIAVEALGRPAAFDPQSDPIVRVEAGRLRKALAQFYRTEGAQEPVRISMPVGSYMPVFEMRSARVLAASAAEVQGQPAATVAQRAISPPPRAARVLARKPAAWAMILGLAIMAAIVGALGSASRPGSPSDDAETAPSTNLRPVGNARFRTPSRTRRLPILAVIVAEDTLEPRLLAVAKGFMRPLVDALVRFDDLISVKLADSDAPEIEADYVLEISASQVADATEGFGSLRSVADGRIVWTTSASRILDGVSQTPELTDMARRLAIKLAEPFGIINADLARRASPPVVNCSVEVLRFRRTTAAADHKVARDCVLQLLEADPDFQPGWASLARLTVAEDRFGIGALPGPPLDRALSAALTAVRLAPGSAGAQQAMMVVLFARGADDEALKAGREAMARNPYDPDIMAGLGARYVQLGRAAEGLPLLQRAIEFSSGRPSAVDFFAFIAAHLLDADALAGAFSAVFVGDESQYSLLGRALCAAQRGDVIDLARAIGQLEAAAPLFALDRGLYLTKLGFRPDVARRILDDLRGAAITSGEPY